MNFDAKRNDDSQPGARHIGIRIKLLRRDKNLTIVQVSEAAGVAPSTLSKIENGRLSPTFDTLLALSRGLGVQIEQVFSDSDNREAIGRRTVTRRGEGREYKTHAYTCEMLCTDISSKKLFPVLARIKLRSMVEFGPAISHEGEEFIYVLSGEIELHTDVYEPLVLGPGDCTFFDSRMRHACLARGSEDAMVLWVCSHADAIDIVKRTDGTTGTDLKPGPPPRTRTPPA